MNRNCFEESYVRWTGTDQLFGNAGCFHNSNAVFVLNSVYRCGPDVDGTADSPVGYLRSTVNEESTNYSCCCCWTGMGGFTADYCLNSGLTKYITVCHSHSEGLFEVNGCSHIIHKSNFIKNSLRYYSYNSQSSPIIEFCLFVKNNGDFYDHFSAQVYNSFIDISTTWTGFTIIANADDYIANIMQIKGCKVPSTLFSSIERVSFKSLKIVVFGVAVIT